MTEIYRAIDTPDLAAAARLVGDLAGAGGLDGTACPPREAAAGGRKRVTARAEAARRIAAERAA